MINQLRSVTVQQIPSSVSPSVERGFLQNLRMRAAAERPRIVLDCSEVEQMDEATLHLLLCCLEEAMKSNGDVKLASLRPSAESALRRARGNRVFEMYPTPAAAIQSFQGYFLSDMAAAFAPEVPLGAENAA